MSVENTHYGAAAIEALLKNCKIIFFIGIGGVSMSSLARLTKLNGYEVAGSDRGHSAIGDALERDGICICYGHDKKNIEGCDAVVYTVAISPDNPEYTEAIRRGIPCISRADYLGYIMTAKKSRLGIAGMHGKSTCTAMCASVYECAGVDPTILSGAPFGKDKSYYRLGDGDNFIFEACEYMDSFLDFNPTSAVILNVELEHVDYFGNIERIRESYERFASITGKDGIIIANGDDEDTMLSVRNCPGRIITFGLSQDCDYRAVDIEYPNGYPCFCIYKNGKFFCRVCLNVPGAHNVYNALACAAAADCDGISPDAISRGLAEFCGAGRRMEYKGSINGARIYDDYGHHPTEIHSTLDGALKLRGETGRLFCVFQPHTYSRLAALFDDFAKSLSLADRVYLAPVFAARETDTLGVSSDSLAAAIGEKACSVCELGDIANELERELCKGDIAVIMGAGNIDKIYEYIKAEEN